MYTLFRAQPYALYRIRPTAKLRVNFRSALFLWPNQLPIHAKSRKMSSNPDTREREDVAENPRKRLKTDQAPSSDDVSAREVQAEAKTPAIDEQNLKETEVGITEFVSRDNEGFSGVFKKRFASFFFFFVCDKLLNNPLLP